MAPADRENAVQALKQMVIAENESFAANNAAPAVHIPTQQVQVRDNQDRAQPVQPPPAKVPKVGFFDDLFSHSSLFPAGDHVRDEVSEYLNENDIEPTAASNDNDVAQYWKRKSTIWPRLSSVARNVLSVPASSTSSERVFSLAGRTLEDRRCQLSPDTVDGLLFLHSLE